MQTRDIYRQVGALHAAAIRQGFLATLGVSFLALMYEAIDAGPDSVLLLAERDGRVIGFVAGSTGLVSIHRRMLKRPLRLVAALLPTLLHPSRIARMVEILRYARGHAETDSLPTAELLSLAVTPDVRGSGTATRLYRRLIFWFHEQGIDAFRITVGDGLTPAHRFYAKMGALSIARVEVHPGEDSVVYRQDIGPASDPLR